MKYKYLDHTADAKFQAFGKSLEEAFENAALAVFNLIVKTEDVKPKIVKKISVQSRKKESLLYDFIEELLYLLDTEGFVLNKIENLKIEEKDEMFHLHAKAWGDSYKHYEVHGSAKSVTYNDMFIKEEKDQVTVQVVIDT
jgi:SHS2 domain-containing protein